MYSCYIYFYKNFNQPCWPKQCNFAKSDLL